MKKLIQICIILFLVVLPVQGKLFAKEETIKQSGLTYTVNTEDQTASVTAADMDLKDVVIPETITMEGAAYTVTSIGVSAFLDHDNLISVYIPNTVNCINRSAFSGCSNLTTVHLPDGITVLNDNTFYNCKKLESVLIPNSVINIDNNVFLGSTFENIVIPSSVTEIKGSSFMYSAVTSITLSNHTNVNANAFYGNSKHKEVLVMVDDINDPINKDIMDALGNSSTFYRGGTNMQASKTAFDVKQDTTLDFTPYINITSKVYDDNGNSTDKMTISDQYLQPGYTLNGAIGTTSMTGNTLYIDPLQTSDFTVDATLNGQTITFTIHTEKPVVVDPSITKVELHKASDHISYIEGETFDPTGLQLVVHYDNNTSEIISYSPSTKDDFVFAVNTPLTLSDTLVKITYKNHSVEQKITVQRLPLIADPTQNQIHGLQSQYERGDRMNIKVTGAGMNHTSPIKGDVRYQPITWNITNKQTFTSANYDIVFDTKDMSKGTYQLTVTYQKETFDGTIWTADTTIQQTKEFEIIEVEVPVTKPETPKDAPKETSKTPQTGDTTSTISYLSLILISGGAMLSLRKTKLKNK